MFALPLDSKSDPRLDLEAGRKESWEVWTGVSTEGQYCWTWGQRQTLVQRLVWTASQKFHPDEFSKKLNTPSPCSLFAQYVAQRLVQNVDKKLLVVTPLRAQHLHHLHKSNIIHKIELSVWLSNDDLAWKYFSIGHSLPPPMLFWLRQQFKSVTVKLQKIPIP